MFEAVAFLYGMIASVVFAGANRNDRLGQPQPPLLTILGYVVVGTLAAISVALIVRAVAGIDPFGAIAEA